MSTTTAATPQAANEAANEAVIETALREHAPLQPITHVDVTDVSANACASSFIVVIVSSAFDGIRLVDRHRLVHDALDKHLPSIHALQLRCFTPQAYAKKTQQDAAAVSS